MKKLSKIISLILVLIIIAASMLSCSARPLAQSKLAKTVVGNVGSHEIYYEELYFFIQTVLNPKIYKQRCLVLHCISENFKII